MNKEIKHTPGPWTISRREDNDIEIRCDYPENPYHKIVAVVLDDSKTDPTEGVMETALLIHAAPELLEACKSVLAWIKDHQDEEWRHDHAQSEVALEEAITKAEGKQ